MPKKTCLATALIAIALAYAGASWWLGRSVQNNYDQWLEQVTASWGEDVVVERRYERGWFRARHTMALKLPAPAAASDLPDLHLHVEEDIRHGPWTRAGLAAAHVRSQLRLADPGGAMQGVYATMAAAGESEFETVIHLSGDFSGQGQLPADTLQGQHQQASWDALDLHYGGNASGTQINVDVSWPQATITQAPDGLPTLRTHLEGLELSINTALSPQWLLPPGTFEARVAALSLSEPRDGSTDFQPRQRLEQLTLRGQTTRNGTTLDAEYGMGARATLGPLELERLERQGRMERVDEQALVMVQRMLTQPDAVDSDEVLHQLVQRLLDAEPSYQEDIRATTTDGLEPRLGWSLTTVGPDSAARALPWPLQALQRLHLKAGLLLPKGLAATAAALMDDPALDPQSLEAMAQLYVAMGWLREEGDTWAAEIEWRDGTLLLNGEPLDLSHLL